MEAKTTSRGSKTSKVPSKIVIHRGCYCTGRATGRCGNFTGPSFRQVVWVDCHSSVAHHLMGVKDFLNIL